MDRRNALLDMPDVVQALLSRQALTQPPSGPRGSGDLRAYEPSIWDYMNQAGSYLGYDDLGTRAADTGELLAMAGMFAPGLAIGPATGAARDGAMAKKLRELYGIGEDFVAPGHGGQRLVQRYAPDSATIFNRAAVGRARYEPVGYHSMQWTNNARGSKYNALIDALEAANDGSIGIVRR